MNLQRSGSFRKPIRPLRDVQEEEDDRRRDLLGRKRVDVVECLLESSADEADDVTRTDLQNRNTILWLTFTEICHIRYVLAQTYLSTLMFNQDKQYSKIVRGRCCFRCRKKINSSSIFDLFLPPSKNITCAVCQQIICKKCSSAVNFIVPQEKLFFAIRIQTLLNSLSLPPIDQVENKMMNKSNSPKITMCHNCTGQRNPSNFRNKFLFPQVFNELSKSQSRPIKAPISPFQRTFSLPTRSSASIETQNIRHRRRVHMNNVTNEKTKIRVSQL